jgi:hypothetical protein
MGSTQQKSGKTKDNGKSIHDGTQVRTDMGRRMKDVEVTDVVNDIVEFGRFRQLRVSNGRIRAIDPDGGFEWLWRSAQEWEDTKKSIIQVYGLPRRKKETQVIFW